MPDPYDVAIIGAGPGGYVAAIRAAQLGLKAAVIEKDAVGGTCLNWGCIPSKALLYSAELLNLYRRGAEFGITTGEVTGDLGVSVDRSRNVVTKFVSGIEALFKQNKVDLIRGAARIEAPGRIRVEPSGDLIEATNILVATGGVTRSLPNVDIDGDRIITSREALELRDIPSSIVIVGGGPIGVEFAYLYRSYGVEVTIVELLPHLLPNEDVDVSRQLERSFAAMGISILTGTGVASISSAADSVTVTVKKDDESQQLTADKVLIGVGFGANSDSLGLEAAGVELNRGWVQVDDYCQTNVPGIWAVGDVTGKLLLAHVASHQGVTAIEKIAGLDPQPLDYTDMPRAVYCQPPGRESRPHRSASQRARPRHLSRPLPLPRIRQGHGDGRHRRLHQARSRPRKSQGPRLQHDRPRRHRAPRRGHSRCRPRDHAQRPRLLRPCPPDARRSPQGSRPRHLGRSRPLLLTKARLRAPDIRISGRGFAPKARGSPMPPCNGSGVPPASSMRD